MSAERKKLKTALCQYKKETLIDIGRVKEFRQGLNEWKDARTTEIQKIRNIKDRADEIDQSISQVMKSEDKGKAALKYMESKMTPDSRRKELEKELSDVLKGTLRGLEELDSFLDAVERLAVTSPHVFEDQVVQLPQDINTGIVQVHISAAQLVCPLLLQIKKKAKTFFCPKLQNAELLAQQLDKYIQTTQEICEKLEQSEFFQKTIVETVVDPDADFSEDSIQGMLRHINQLNEIRENKHFRMVFLFEEESSCHSFISEFDKRQSKMQQSLSILEKNAVQLDKMNTGAKISSVAGSSVGMVGSVLSIVGLALMPVTAGVSFALTMTGVGLGITQGVNSIITKVTGRRVNYKHENEACEASQRLMEDMKVLQSYLDKSSSPRVTNMEASKTDAAVGAKEVLFEVGGVGKKIKSINDAASDMNILQSEDLITEAGEAVAHEGEALCNLPSVVSYISQSSVDGSAALLEPVMAGCIALSAFFIVKDIYTIYKDSRSLAQGSEAKFSQSIRARAAIWKSEIRSWRKIRNSLHQGLQTSEKKQATLEMPFAPEKENQGVRKRRASLDMPFKPLMEIKKVDEKVKKN